VNYDLTSGLPFRVWQINTGQAPDSSDLAIVDAAERDRARKCVRERDRNSFLKTRAALRRILGRIIDAEPQTIKFEENAWGKPLLAGKTARPISFSVSRTEDLSVIATFDGRRIGVDVERARSIAEHDRIASDVFGVVTAQALSRLEDVAQDGAFLRLWTAAEAFLKATGTGFAGNRARIPVSLSGSSGAVRLGCRLASAEVRSLSLFELSLPRGYLGSMIVEGAPRDAGNVIPEHMISLA
jgi:4'-phosphopantetheinyl transferase